MNIFNDVSKTIIRLDSESINLISACIQYAGTTRRALDKVLKYKITQQDREAAKPLLHDGQRRSYTISSSLLRHISEEAKRHNMSRDDYINFYVHAAAPAILRACENFCTLIVGRQSYIIDIDTLESHIKKLITEKQNFSVKF